MKLFYLLLRANGPKVMLAVVISILSGATGFAVLPLFHHVWDHSLLQSPFWIGAFVLLLVVMVFTGYWGQIMVLDLALKTVRDLRLELSSKILSTPLRELERMGSHRQLAVLTEDVTTLSRVLPFITRFASDVTTLAAGAVWMFLLSWQALLVVGAFLVVGIGIYHLMLNRSMVHMRRGRDEFDVVFDHFRALHDGSKQLKLNRKRRKLFLFGDLRDSLEAFRDHAMAGRRVLVGAEVLTRFLFFALLGLMVFGIPYFLSEGGTEVMLGYVLVALFLFRPVNSLMMLVPDFGLAAVALQKIESLGLALDNLESEPGVNFDSDAGESLKVANWKQLELRGTSYTYRHRSEDAGFRMGPIDLVLKPGELVFIEGGNGSGKTTFAKVLCSLYSHDEGEILLDGVPITDENRESYRQLFSVVFFDFHIFGKLVSDAGDEIDALAKVRLNELELAHKVTVSDGMLSTQELSQGQRKRLALLTAYVEDRPIYLFDEWAADQDPQFKKIFYTKILPELKASGKTVIAITHDDRYMHLADRRLKLEEGALVSESTPRPAEGSAIS